jgi:tetratricopeptide (TPR) repeat protein
MLESIRTFAAIALVAALSAPSAAAPPREEAKQLKDLGAQALERGDFAQALEYFDRAYRLYPSSRLRYNLGLAYDHLGRVPEAIDAFEGFLAEASPDAPSEAREHARARLKDLTARIARLQIVVDPPDADLRLDGRPLARPSGAIRLLAGAHRLEASATGRQPSTLELTLAAGESKELTLQLLVLEETSVGSPSPSVVAPPAGPKRRGKQIAGITLGVVGIGALAGGIAFAALGASAQDQVLKMFDPALERDGRNDNIAAGILFGIGGAAVISGVVLLAIGTRDARRAPAVAATGR